MREIGLMIKQMGTESIDREMELFIKDNGKMINKKDKGLKYGKIKLNMKVNLKMVKKMVLEYLSSMMGQNLRVSSNSILSMEKEIFFGKMAKNTLVSG